jgi:hypothetical protein
LYRLLLIDKDGAYEVLKESKRNGYIQTDAMQRDNRRVCVIPNLVGSHRFVSLLSQETSVVRDERNYFYEQNTQ